VKKNMPLYKHLEKPGHTFEKLRVTILEKVSSSNLHQKEIEWMTRLNTFIPNGLNSTFT